MDSPTPSSGPSFEIAPFRANDFMGKFKPPAFNDPARFTRRIRDNLLYYQTNYFAIWLIACILSGILKPDRMMKGVFSAYLFTVIYLLVASKLPIITNFKERYAAASMAVLILCIGLVFYFFDVYLLLWGILTPLVMILSHATFRARNLTNKITKHLESLGFGTTPMGKVLTLLGIDIK
ncbi:PRA1 family protein 3 [Tetranychus urticae]|uniref:PRA1 family protein n=1 Tax=Tetranychus urticae TaxID=32264 RepID=T1KNU9_TETUR|nr:PRA1 family protein 3 [Tetranychus urticae]XP_015788827.1 PRA1 family protein 3 [Tetranychus urticae]